jgi:2'-5' RNA ligase
LLYPFLASPSIAIKQGSENESPQLKDDICTRIQQAVKTIEPFQVSLNADPAGVFSHSKRSKTVWLGSSSQNVQKLQAALQAEFVECNADQRPFIPHLSVGQATSDNGAHKIGEEIKSSIIDFLAKSEDAPVALEWYVDKVYIIERKGYHHRFKIVGSIELGK